jgi:hypothetical protein
MVIRKSYLRRRAEHGPGSVVIDDSRPSSSRPLMNRIGSLIFSDGRFGRKQHRRELEAFPLPDLLSPTAEADSDPERLTHLLDLAFLGRASAGELDRELDAMTAGHTPWRSEHFTADLFLSELVNSYRSIEVCGHRFHAHGQFLERALATPADGDDAGE